MQRLELEKCRGELGEIKGTSQTSRRMENPSLVGYREGKTFTNFSCSGCLTAGW